MRKATTITIIQIATTTSNGGASAIYMCMSDEDIEQRIQTLAEANNMGINELKRSLRRNNELENIKESLLEENIWAFLMQHIKIEEAAPAPLWVSPEEADAAEGEDE